MKTRTEKILMVLKFLAYLGAIGYAIECGSELLSFASSSISPDWAKRVNDVDLDIFSLREHDMRLYVYAMLLAISLSAMKAVIWFMVADLLAKLKLNTPFSIEVAKKLEKIAYMLLGIWGIGIIMRVYANWVSKTTGVLLTGNVTGGEYLFIAGFAYIISQIFKRGIEMQEENQLTV